MVAIVAILGYLGTRRGIGQVHHIVNQQRTDGQKYQEDLRSALSHAGVAIPPDASLAPDAHETDL